jgi:hypothetical protein
MHKSLFFGLILILSACAPGALDRTPVPTVPVLVGQVDILTPATGSIIYAETLTIAGTAANLPAEGFTVRVVTARDQLLAQTTLHNADLDNGTWSLDIAHGYTGDPTEISVTAAAANPVIPGDYDVSSVLLLPLAQRPAGVFGVIRSPAEGAVMGGDLIQIEGTLSGVADKAFTLVLSRRDGDVISEQQIQLAGYTPLDEGVWRAQIPTEGYVGPVVLRMRLGADDIPEQNGEADAATRAESGRVLADVAFMLSLAAG